jgi:large subunit ribosomal protein L6
MAQAPTGSHQKESRTGKRPVAVPGEVKVSIAGNQIHFKGPKGELKRQLHEAVEVRQDGASLVVAPRKGAGKRGVQFQGLTRALVANAVEGVSTGFTKSLDLHGVGYRATLKGQELTLGLGLSHSVVYNLPGPVNARIETIDEAGTKRPRILLDSPDKELLGQAAARIKSFRPPEPYKGKGVRYTGEKIREKAGKAGKGAGA